MAINNAEKRRSISGIAMQPWAAPGVTPNILKDAQWRAQSAWSYSGLIPDPPVGGVIGPDKITLGTKESLGITVYPTVGSRWSF